MKKKLIKISESYGNNILTVYNKRIKPIEKTN